MLSINVGWAAGVILGVLSSAAVSGKLNKDEIVLKSCEAMQKVECNIDTYILWAKKKFRHYIVIFFENVHLRLRNV